MFLAAKQDRHSPHKAVLLANGRGITHRPRVKHVEQICSIPPTRLYCRPMVRLPDSGISVHRASGCSQYPSYRPAHLAQQMSQPPGSNHPHALRLYIYILSIYYLWNASNTPTKSKLPQSRCYFFSSYIFWRNPGRYRGPNLSFALSANIV